MDWFRELSDLYDKNQNLAGQMQERKSKNGKTMSPLVLLPVFHTTVAAQITVTIDKDGNFLRAEAVPEEDKTTIIPVTEKSGSRTAGIEPHPFCDTLKYLAGDYMVYCRTDGKVKNFHVNYERYMEALESWRESMFSHEKVNALYAYLKKSTLAADLVRCEVLKLDESGRFSKDKLQKFPQEDAFVRFRIECRQDFGSQVNRDSINAIPPECWRDLTLMNSFIAYYRSTLRDKDLCYLTGEEVPISYLQPKKIRNEGDGSKLISANDDIYYTYRGRFVDKRQAFAVGYEASQKAHNALKWIIRKQGYQYEGLCVVVWQSDLQPLPDWNADTDTICDDFALLGLEEEEYAGVNTPAAERVKRAMRGYGKNFDDMSHIVLLAFDSATTGRLAMVENKVFQASSYLRNITYWHESCQWVQVKYKEQHRFEYIGMAGIKDIAEALYGTEQDGVLTIGGKGKLYAVVCKRILPCITDKRPIPEDMVRLAVQRASSPVSYQKRYNWERILGIACSFVKKYYKEVKKEEWTLDLNKSNKREYLYGRLLAVADRIEYRTYDKEKDAGRMTNAMQYMNAFSQHPYRTWQIIEERIIPYLQKLNIVERNYYKKQLDEICDLFQTEEDFMNDKPMDGLYLLGYHNQSYEMKYNGNKNEEGTKDDKSEGEN